MRVAPEIKAAALADLLDGQQPAVVAARYGIIGSTVRNWKLRLDLPVATPVATEGTGVATGVAIRQPAIEAQQLAIGDLIQASLKAKIYATQKIAEYATTDAWLQNQTAADVATLFTAIDNAAVAILDRMASRAHDADQLDADAGDAA